MASLYERFASTEDGARRLANARLRREALKVLHRALKASGLSQVELAKRLGVRKSAVSQVLNGDGNVRVTTLAEYLYATGHELSMTVVPAGQPRAEVLARRASVAITRHAYSTAEQASRTTVLYKVRFSHTDLARALPQFPLLQATDWSPLLFGEQHIESGSVETT